jgi:hypothetical protein
MVRSSLPETKGRFPTSRQRGAGISLIEFTNASAEVRERFPAPVGSVFCVLTLINARQLDGR